MMRIGIMGAGAVGSMVGALLTSEMDVILIGRPKVAMAIKERGVRVSGKTELHVRPEASSDPADLEGCDIVMLTVKAYDTAEAASMVSLTEPGAMLVTLQNGLANDARVREVAPGLNSCAALTSMGVTYLGPGHVRHAGQGDTVLGRMACSPLEAERTAEILTKGGFPITFVANVRGHVWLKGIVNHCINPLTVIHRCRNGVLLEHKEYLQHLTGLCSEALMVTNAEAIDLPTEDILGHVKEVASLTAENRSSMLQDVDRGKRTEIDHITGHLIKVGKGHGLDLPLSEFIYYEIKNLEQQGLDREGPPA
jgi:2-dehydropantoate 2-reductase